MLWGLNVINQYFLQLKYSIIITITYFHSYFRSITVSGSSISFYRTNCSTVTQVYSSWEVRIIRSTRSLGRDYLQCRYILLTIWSSTSTIRIYGSFFNIYLCSIIIVYIGNGTWIYLISSIHISTVRIGTR